jgi:single-strand DNA-binding protein
MTMNKILVIGNLGRDPEMRYTPGGQAVTNFSVATNYKYTTSEGEPREETEWFTVSAWGKLGEICNQYLAKGRKVYVEGRLKSRSYETRDGQTRFVNEISATDVRFIDTSGRTGDYPQDPGQASETPMEPDDLPF